MTALPEITERMSLADGERAAVTRDPRLGRWGDAWATLRSPGVSQEVTDFLIRRKLLELAAPEQREEIGALISTGGNLTHSVDGPEIRITNHGFEIFGILLRHGERWVIASTDLSYQHILGIGSPAVRRLLPGLSCCLVAILRECEPDTRPQSGRLGSLPGYSVRGSSLRDGVDSDPMVRLLQYRADKQEALRASRARITYPAP